MTDKTDSKECEAFEAWASRSIGRVWRDTTPGRTDCYQDASTNIGWRAWQARASLAANAGSEPVAQAKGVFEFWWADHMPNATQAEAWREWCELMRPGPVAVTHPSPPEGMVGGWISVEERLPPPFEEVVVYPRPDDYCCEAFSDTAGKWKWAEYEHNFGVHHRECQVEYWLMLPEVPAPPTTSAGSGKGE